MGWANWVFQENVPDGKIQRNKEKALFDKIYNHNITRFIV